MNTRLVLREALPYLRPHVPDDDAVPVVELSDPDSPVLRSFVGDLLIAYLVEADDHLVYVQGRHLEPDGLSPEALHSAAVANLARVSEGRIILRSVGPIHLLTLDGNFEASLMLMHDLWSETLSDYFVGAPVVAVPARDVLAFSSVGVDGGVDELRAVVERVWPTDDHLLSKSLYTFVDGTWRVY